MLGLLPLVGMRSPPAKGRRWACTCQSSSGHDEGRVSRRLELPNPGDRSGPADAHPPLDQLGCKKFQSHDPEKSLFWPKPFGDFFFSFCLFVFVIEIVSSKTPPSPDACWAWSLLPAASEHFSLVGTGHRPLWVIAVLASYPLSKWTVL